MKLSQIKKITALIFLALLAAGTVSAKVKKISYKPSEKGVENARLFKTFGGCGVQIWQDEWNDHDMTFSLDYAEGTITVGSVGWWGGAFGSYDNGKDNGNTFDLSKVAEVRFDAKASTYGTVYFNIDNNNKNELDIATEYMTYSVPVKKASAKATNLFVIGGVRDLSDPGTTITLKNVSFYDAKGKEIVPQYN